MADGTETGADANAETVTASVIGGSGFTGGELLRLLAGHPNFDITEVTSRSKAGKSVAPSTPPLRGSDLRFTEPDDLESVDVLFAATPTASPWAGSTTFRYCRYRRRPLGGLPPRERSPVRRGSGTTGTRPRNTSNGPEYALPEINRENLEGADLIAGGGCNATATILGLYPLFEHGILEGGEQIVVDVKVGSSEGGAGGEASSHPERSGVVRPYAPTGHRHEGRDRAVPRHLGRLHLLRRGHDPRRERNEPRLPLGTRLEG